jgi:hypothetical protein
MARGLPQPEAHRALYDHGHAERGAVVRASHASFVALSAASSDLADAALAEVSRAIEQLAALQLDDRIEAPQPAAVTARCDADFDEACSNVLAAHRQARALLAADADASAALAAQQDGFSALRAGEPRSALPHFAAAARRWSRRDERQTAKESG